MTAAALTFWITALVIFGFGPAYLLVRDYRKKKAAAARRAEEKRRADDEWKAVLAATQTPLYERPALPQRRPTDLSPIYDALMCARIAKEEGWV